MKDYELFNEDCLNAMEKLPPNSINLIATDLPYGCTQCSWDHQIDLERLWKAFRRILSPAGVITLTADFKFASALLTTSPKGWFRYDLIWDKKSVTGFLDANRRPLRQHELILVFSPKGYPTYNPIKTPGKPYVTSRSGGTPVYNEFKANTTANATGDRYPTSILRISKTSSNQHPTQKPEELMDWLIQTYSNPNDLVLDCAMGSGTTGVSALKNNRRFIGIEMDPTYFEVAKERIEKQSNI